MPPGMLLLVWLVMYKGLFLLVQNSPVGLHDAIQLLRLY